MRAREKPLPLKKAGELAFQEDESVEKCERTRTKSVVLLEAKSPLRW